MWNVHQTQFKKKKLRISTNDKSINENTTHITKQNEQLIFRTSKLYLSSFLLQHISENNVRGSHFCAASYYSLAAHVRTANILSD